MNVSSPMQISILQISQRLEGLFQRSQRWQAPGTVYFPTRTALSMAVPLHSLATPWESELQGFRIADFRCSGLRVLQREKEKIVWSRLLGPGDYEFLIDAFFTRVESLMMQLDFTFGRKLGEECVIDLQTCKKLLVSSFVDPVKPRLIPHLQLPAKDECLKELKRWMPASPWRLQMPDAQLALSKVGGELSFVDSDERGQVVFASSSTNEEEILWSVFRYIFQMQTFEDDSKLSFDWFSFPS